MERKWTFVMFAVGAVVLAYLLVKSGDWLWGLYGTRPNELLLDAVAFAIAGGATLVAVRNERVFALATEVTTELRKVTWPTRQETFAATIVVIVTVIVSSIFLGIFDGLWGWLTQILFNG